MSLLGLELPAAEAEAHIIVRLFHSVLLENLQIESEFQFRIRN